MDLMHPGEDRAQSRYETHPTSSGEASGTHHGGSEPRAAIVA